MIHIFPLPKIPKRIHSEGMRVVCRNPSNSFRHNVTRSCSDPPQRLRPPGFKGLVELVMENQMKKKMDHEMEPGIIGFMGGNSRVIF